mgnify:FL=1
MKVYVASSWRNARQPEVVAALRADGHEVYDFRNPRPGDRGFNWRDLDPAWETWSAEKLREMLEHPVAVAGFEADMEALQAADLVVLVLPCGRSAHLELGWAIGAGKASIALLDGGEPELMYRLVNRLALSVEEVVEWAEVFQAETEDAAGVGCVDS